MVANKLDNNTVIMHIFVIDTLYINKPTNKTWSPPQKPPRIRAKTAPPAAPVAEFAARNVEARIQLGARIPEAKYRQLKLAAVLRGVTVQTLVF